MKNIKKILISLFLIFSFTCSSATNMYQQDLISGALPLPGSVTAVWMGTAGLYISDGETGLYIDPYVSRHGMLRVGLGFRLEPRLDQIKEWIKRTGGEKASAVIVTHSHFDHSMDAPYFAMLAGAYLVGSESTANIGLGAGLKRDKIKVIDSGDFYKAGRFEIIFIESRHGAFFFGKAPWPGEIKEPLVPPASASQYKSGKTFTIIIRHPKGTILHNGSAGFIPGHLNGLRADIVLLGIGGRSDTPSLINNIVVPVKAKILIPIHFDDFFATFGENFDFLINVKYSEFVETCISYKSDFVLRTLPAGRRVVLFL